MRPRATAHSEATCARRLAIAARTDRPTSMETISTAYQWIELATATRIAVKPRAKARWRAWSSYKEEKAPASANELTTQYSLTGPIARGKITTTTAHYACGIGASLTRAGPRAIDATRNPIRSTLHWSARSGAGTASAAR